MRKEYIGKTCPYCKTPLVEDDTVVFCSVCDMPHHLSCWQDNQGCTTFGCTGTINKIPGETTEATPTAVEQENKANSVPVKVVGREKHIEVLYESNEFSFSESVPVAVENVAIIIDRIKDALFARCTLRSLEEKPIQAVLVEISCQDVWGNDLGEPITFQYLDLKTKRGTTFGQTDPIKLLDKTTRKIHVTVEKVLFAEGQVAYGGGAQFAIPSPVPLNEHFGSAALAEEFCRCTSKKSKYVPIQADRAWRCSCGSFCRDNEDTCFACGIPKEQLFAVLNDPQLEENMLAYQAEQERIQEEARLELEQRQREAEARAKEEREQLVATRLEEERVAKKKKRKKRWRLSLSIGVPLLAAIACAIIFVGIPYLDYRNACDALDRGEYDEAYAVFMDLDGQFDSDEKAKNSQYQKAGVLLAEKRYDEAKAIYLSLESYSDSDTMAKECDYQKAMALLDDDDYDAAKNVFLQLGNYSNSSDMAKESVYRKGLNFMEADNENGYKKAISCFEEILGYSDSAEMWKEATYKIAGIYSKKTGVYQKKEAAVAYESISGYKDSDSLFEQNMKNWITQLSERSVSDVENNKMRCDLLTDYMETSDKAKQYVLSYIQTQCIYQEEYWFFTSTAIGIPTFMDNRLCFVTTLTRKYQGSSAEHKLFRFMESLADLYDDYMNGHLTWGEYQDRLRELRSKFDTYFDYPVIQAYIKYNMPYLYLEGYWTGSGYYLQFYKHSDGLTWSSYDLPRPSEPWNTDHYAISNMTYIWCDENGHELTKVWRFDLVSPYEMRVYCYSNGRTYTLYR